jgi:hypothetical protein
VSYANDLGFKEIVMHTKPTAIELSMIEAEERMQKMLSSPFAESLERHEAMINYMTTSPALQAIEMQNTVIDSLLSKSFIESAICSLRESSMMCNMAKSMDELLKPYYCQYVSFAKTSYDAFDPGLPLLATTEDVARGMLDYVTRLDSAMNYAAAQIAMIENMAPSMLDSVTKYGTEMVTALEQEAQAMSWDSHLREMLAMESAFRSYDISSYLGLSDNLKLFKNVDFEEKNDMLKNFGWYMIAELPEEIADYIYERRDEITQEEVDALIVQHFRRNRCKELKVMVNNWKQLPYFKKRQVVFHDVQVCHSRRSFNALTTLISLQFEGVVTDFVRDRIMVPTFRKWPDKALRCVTDLTNNLTMASMSLEEWIVYSYVLECVDKVFTTNFSPADPDCCPNTSRHKIAHGQATAKETEANSLRRFLFMNELYKLFSCLENEYLLAS